MGKRKTSADFYLMDLRRTGWRAKPLFGLDRLIKLAHRKRNGILYCDNVVNFSDSATFAYSNKRHDLYAIHYLTGYHGVLSDIRSNVPNEASAEDLQRFRNDGVESVFSFTPKNGKTISWEFDKYRAFDEGRRFAALWADKIVRVAKWEVTLDVSAYLSLGFSLIELAFEYESPAVQRNGKKPARGRIRRLTAVEKGEGLWICSVNNVTGGAVRITWELRRPDASRLSQAVNLEKLITELSVNPRLAKDLHNFVMICHYYVAGVRSLRKIAHEMVAGKTAVDWSLESLEKAIGAELIQRTKGKGLIDVTPAGEAVLDWWSQFYMRWTPISV